MARVTHDLDEPFRAVPESIPRARELVGQFAATAAGANDRQLQDIRLAVSEAVTNAVLHGYRGTPGVVWVKASVDARGTLTVVVRDAGAGQHPGPPQPGLGLGLGLIKDAADELTIVPRVRGTELRMRFELARIPMFV